MKIAVPILVLALQLTTGDPLTAAGFKPQKGACGIKVVSYRFVGTPGREFEYAGARRKIPAAGWIELLAKKDAEIAGPADSFGTVTVCLDGPTCVVPAAPKPGEAVEQEKAVIRSVSMDECMDRCDDLSSTQACETKCQATSRS